MKIRAIWLYNTYLRLSLFQQGLCMILLSICIYWKPPPSTHKGHNIQI